MLLDLGGLPSRADLSAVPQQRFASNIDRSASTASESQTGLAMKIIIAGSTKQEDTKSVMADAAKMAVVGRSELSKMEKMKVAIKQARVALDTLKSSNEVQKTRLQKQLDDLEQETMTSKSTKADADRAARASAQRNDLIIAQIRALDAERAVELDALRDPAHANPCSPGFRMYLKGDKANGMGADDKLVVATALKNQFCENAGLTCVCMDSEDDVRASTLGEVLDGVNCQCYENINREWEPAKAAAAPSVAVPAAAAAPASS